MQVTISLGQQFLVVDGLLWQDSHGDRGSGQSGRGEFYRVGLGLVRGASNAGHRAA